MVQLYYLGGYKVGRNPKPFLVGSVHRSSHVATTNSTREVKGLVIFVVAAYCTAILFTCIV